MYLFGFGFGITEYLYSCLHVSWIHVSFITGDFVLQTITLPETNSSHLKHWGWKMSFLFGSASCQVRTVSFRECMISLRFFRWRFLVLKISYIGCMAALNWQSPWNQDSYKIGCLAQIKESVFVPALLLLCHLQCWYHNVFASQVWGLVAWKHVQWWWFPFVREGAHASHRQWQNENASYNSEPIKTPDRFRWALQKEATSGWKSVWDLCRLIGFSKCMPECPSLRARATSKTTRVTRERYATKNRQRR